MKKSEELFIYKLNNKLWIAHRIGDKAQIIPTFSDTSFTNYNRSKIERHMMRLGVNRITRKSYSEVFKLNKVLLSKPVTICLMDSIEDGIDAEAFKNVCDLCIHTSRQTVGYKAITPKLVSIRIPHKNKKDFGYKRILLSEHNQLINIDLKNYSFLKN